MKCFRRVTSLCLLLLATLSSGCGSARFRCMPLPQDAVSSYSVPDARFRIQTCDTKIVNYSMGQPFVNFDTSQTNITSICKKYYPHMFEDSYGAIPLEVTIRKTLSDNSAVGVPCLFGSLMTFPLVFPLPVSTKMDLEINTRLDSPIHGPILNETRTYMRKDAMWISALTPLGLIPALGKSDAERISFVSFFPEDIMPKESLRLSSLCVKDAVGEVLLAADAEKLQAAAAYWKNLSTSFSVNGRSIYVTLTPAPGEGFSYGNPDNFNLELREGNSIIAVMPIASKGPQGRWGVRKVYIPELPPLYAGTAMLKDGVPVRAVVEKVDSPPVEDFIKLVKSPYKTQKETMRYGRWRTEILLMIKNKHLPRIIQERSRDELLDLITKMEKAVLDLNYYASSAKDRAQFAVEKDTGNPSIDREHSRVFTERIVVLKQMIIGVKQALATKQ